MFSIFLHLPSESLEENKKKVDVQLKEVTSERDSLTRNFAEALQSLKQVKIMTYFDILCSQESNRTL